jgi:hypothetical protein
VDIPYWPGYVGIADQDFVCKYSDYNVLNIPQHNPLYVDVIQASHAWGYTPLDKIILYNIYVIPTQSFLQDAYITYSLQGKVGNVVTGGFATDDDDVASYYPQHRLALIEDLPGGPDGTAVSPVGIKIFPPENLTDSLNWTFVWYDHHHNTPMMDPLIYEQQMASHTIMPNQTVGGQSIFALSFGPMDLVVGDTLFFRVAEILGNGVNGVLTNSIFLDSLLSGVLKPELILSSLELSDLTPDSLFFDYTITNSGTAPANLDGPTASDSDNVAIQAFYSEDEIFNNGNDIFAGYTILGPSPLGMLQPGESFNGVFNSAQPANFLQTPYLTMMADADDVVDELIEENNTKATLIVRPPQILAPADSQQLLVVSDTTSNWPGIPLRFTPANVVNAIIEYAWSVDGGTWNWTSDTALFLHPNEFAPPLTGEHLIRVTWGINQQVIDPRGDSIRVFLAEATFENPVLIIDETDESNFPFGVFPPGTPNAAKDDSVDNFYTDVFGYSSSWDYQSDGFPPLETIGQHQLIIWHGDDRPVTTGHQFPLYVDVFESYLNIGGDLILSGWRMLKSFNWNQNFPVTYPEGSFVRDYLQIVEGDESPIAPSDFTAAAGVSPFSSVSVDSLKLLEFPYFGKLANVNVIRERGSSADSIYTYIGELSNFNGVPCGVWHQSSAYNVVFLGFPIFFLQKDDAQTLGAEILQALGYQPGAIESEASEIPFEYSLAQNYPNPFNPTTTISFSIVKSGPVSLIVYDILGRKVKTLVNDPMTPGVYELNFDTRNLPSGVYFYRLTAESFTETKKMLLIR